jgi:pimeloyl-ACP methyl ester carboxylesterase
MSATATNGRVAPAESRPRSGLAENGGVWIAWRSEGEPQASTEPVLMIMGLAASSRGWFRLLPRLAAERECVVFDNRGTGDSDRPLGRYSMADFVGDALAVMDSAGLERPHVLGASMGGMIALQLALAVPERVRSLSLLCTTPGGGPGGSPRSTAAILLRPLLGAKRAFAFAAPTMYSRRTRAERRDRLSEDLKRRQLDATPGAAVIAQIAAVMGHDARDRLAEIEAPTLVVHGLEDGMIPPVKGRELASGIRGARLELLADAGHILTTDAEEETVAAITSFLGENDS